MNRVAVGAEIKHNEKEKGLYTEDFRNNMDMKRRGAEGGPIDPKENIEIDDEYLEGIKRHPITGLPMDDHMQFKSPTSKKTVAMRPGETEQTVVTHHDGPSGYEHDGNESGYLQHTSMNKLTTQ